jgi:hypothetical protein
LTEKILDFQKDCGELQDKNAKLRGENEELKRETEALKKREDIRGKIRFVGDAYLLTDELGQRAICPACFEQKGVPIPLGVTDLAMVGSCPACKATYEFPFPDIERTRRLKQTSPPPT